MLVGLGVGGLQLHRMATTSEFFAIKRVEIRGTTHFSREEVLKAANLQSGVNSLTVNIADVEQGLRDNPWVLSVAVKRRLPDAFEIRIRERIPAQILVVPISRPTINSDLDMRYSLARFAMHVGILRHPDHAKSDPNPSFREALRRHPAHHCCSEPEQGCLFPPCFTV